MLVPFLAIDHLGIPSGSYTFSITSRAICLGDYHMRKHLTLIRNTSIARTPLSVDMTSQLYWLHPLYWYWLALDLELERQLTDEASSNYSCKPRVYMICLAAHVAYSFVRSGFCDAYHTGVSRIAVEYE